MTIRRTWLFVFVMACGTSSTPTPTPPEETRPLAPLAPKVTLVGPVLDPNGSKFGRDGASSGALGGKILYTFGDTLFFTKSVDGQSARSNTAAYAELSQPTVLSEPLDANGLPAQLIPFTAEEQAYNDKTQKGDDRWVIWPGRVVQRPGGATAIVYFDLFRIHPDKWEGVGTGVGEIGAGQTVAKRLPDLVFKSPEVDFTHATFEQDGTVYVYGCDLGLCRLAKSALTEATTRAGYTFWTGDGWSAAYADAAQSIPGSGAGFSVNYDAYLDQYVSFTSSGIGKTVLMRVAKHPWGPFSDPTEIYAFPSGNVYAAGQHPALDQDGGKRIFISAYNDLGNFKGEIDLMTVDLVKR
ncbi:hypothetical protein BH09MYX1_BH09MYX1_41940 [soil metagenome]